MKIVSKSQADKILVESLFRPGGTLNVEKFDNGKYKWYGSAKHYIGKDVPDLKNVKIYAVYVERRQDASGPYAQLMCITE